MTEFEKLVLEKLSCMGKKLERWENMELQLLNLKMDVRKIKEQLDIASFFACYS